MWLSRRSFALGIVALLPSCGFKPLSDPGHNEITLLGLGKFDFFLPRDDISFKIKEELVKDLGFPDRPTHRISVNSNLTSRKGLITKKNEITRYSLVLVSTFELISLRENKKVFQKDIITQTAYSASKNVTGFATKTAEESAKKRLAKDIAKKITMELLILGKDF